MDEHAKVFAKNFNNYLAISGFNKTEIAKKLNVSTSVVSCWALGQRMPRMGNLDELCSLFGCSRTDLIEERTSPMPIERYVLSDDEKELLASYRELSPIDKGRALEQLSNFAKEKRATINERLSNLDEEQKLLVNAVTNLDANQIKQLNNLLGIR